MDLRSLLAILRRRWRALAICVIAGILGASVVTTRAVPQYASSARLFVNIPRANSVAEQVQGVQLSVQLLQSYARIATSRSAAEKMVAQLHLNEGPDSLRSRIAASPQPETLLIDVTAVDKNPQEAARIANTAASVLIQTIDELEKDKATRVTAQVIDEAVPASAPFSPRKKVNLAIGTVLGLLVGFLLALGLEGLDRSIKTPAQAAEAYHTSLLAVTPRSRDVRERPVPEDALSPMAEAFRSLRTAVRFIEPDHPLRTIVVTSAVSGEGKTTTAINLAVALAQSGERVLLVDADLRRARIATILGLESAVGLTSVITHTVPLADALQPWLGVAVLTAGVLPPNPSEMLGSQAMAGLIEEMRDMADVVVFDAPPVLPVTDSVVLSTLVDGVIVITRHGSTQKAQAAEARRRLAAVGAKIAGTVLNAVPASAAHGYYEEYYARRPQQTMWGRRWTDRAGR